MEVSFKCFDEVCLRVESMEAVTVRLLLKIVYVFELRKCSGEYVSVCETENILCSICEF
jgi:hypothetical protein